MVSLMCYSKIKENSKIALAFILGFLISGIAVYASTVLSSGEVSYDNSKSHSSYDNVQGAIEELYRKSGNCTVGACSLVDSKFVIAYTYNQNQGSKNYCVTGDEETCVRTDCYTSSKTCPAGTIIDYIVSGTNIRERFHVVSDKGNKIVMQSQKNIIKNVAWYTQSDNTKGPLTILPVLEEATSSWTNVETQKYVMGETTFKNNAFTGCSDFDSCNTNVYTLASRTAKARMITVQEAADLGCTTQDSSCPIWMYNYLYQSTLYGGTVADSSQSSSTSDYNHGYWTMNAYSLDSTHVWYIAKLGHIYANYSTGSVLTLYGARAVVEVSK